MFISPLTVFNLPIHELLTLLHLMIACFHGSLPIFSLLLQCYFYEAHRIWLFFHLGWVFSLFNNIWYLLDKWLALQLYRKPTWMLVSFETTFWKCVLNPQDLGHLFFSFVNCVCYTLKIIFQGFYKKGLPLIYLYILFLSL